MEDDDFIGGRAIHIHPDPVIIHAEIEQMGEIRRRTGGASGCVEIVGVELAHHDRVTAPISIRKSRTRMKALGFVPVESR